MYKYKAPHDYSEEYVNKLRTYGFERITFIRGEEYLLLIKTTEEEDAEPDGRPAGTEV